MLLKGNVGNIYKKMDRINILLDCDGVICDFLSGAIDVLNKKYKRDYTVEQYARNFGEFGIDKFYGITTQEFWDTITETENFWYNLQPFPWAKELYDYLKIIGNVTIVTSPSLDPDCAKQKLMWLKHHLNIDSTDVFIGSKKHLMAGNGLLIDDYKKNVMDFMNNGGDAIIVPSNWNSIILTKELVFDTIERDIYGY